MVKIFRSIEIKKAVEKLRKEGKTYREIWDIFKIPKSTLSYWLGEKFPGIFDKTAQLHHLANIRIIALQAKERRRQEEYRLLQEKIRREMVAYPLDNPGVNKIALAMLYWAEGAKHKGVSGLKFVNTDPDLIKFYITLLRKSFIIDEDKFRIRLHLHYYHRITKTKEFWSKLLDVPLNKFGKIYLKKRSKTKRFRKNFQGICFVAYLDSRIRKELMEIAKQLAKTV